MDYALQPEDRTDGRRFEVGRFTQRLVSLEGELGAGDADELVFVLSGSGTASVGAYINYLEPSRALSSYYGTNYTRLRQLRTKFDPNGLFRGKYVIPAA